MRRNRITLQIVVLSLVVFVATSAMVVFLPSSVYEWANLKASKTKAGEFRQIIKSPTKTLEMLDVSATTLTQPGKFKIGSEKGGLEEFIILKEGKIKYNQNGQTTILNPGTVILFPSGINREVENGGKDKICYYTVKWKSVATHITDPKVKTDQPIVYDWDKLEFKKNAKGGSR
ncbi:MAG: cupin domain-containing protein, partial [Bacteroidota bacterium]|nr:cupin domain-containing protein [Bacteroidota bacterium]